MIKKGYLLGLLIALCNVCLSCAQEEVKLPKTYISYNTIDSIVVDGKPNELSWEKAKSTDLFIDIEGEKTPKYKTSVKILHSEEYIYFLATLEEPHVWGNLKERDTIVYYNNDFELFLDPDNDTYNYYEIEINALNTVWDLFITKPYREKNAVLNNWNMEGMRSAISVNGTLNDPTDIDKSWTLEIAIPLENFKTSYFQKIELDENFWRINFSRVNWEFQLENNKYSRKKDKNNKYLSENNWVWSPQYEIAMHKPENWGYVYFSKNNVGNKDEFTIPKDEELKLLLYKLYNSQKEYYSANKTFASNLKQLNSIEVVIDKKKIQPVLENHLTGFNIYVKSPFTNITYFIKEDGKIIIQN